jgi:hypothetical protein
MEIIANAVQTVAANQNVYFTDSVTSGGCAIEHRDGSGLVTLRGLSGTQNRARFRVSFGANIAISTGGTVEPISLAIALDGESVPATVMTITPAAVGDFFNVSSSIFIDIPRGCCSHVSIKNISTQSVDVINANLIAERVA